MGGQLLIKTSLPDVVIIIAETGGIMITPRPSPDDSTPKPGFPMRPFFGVDPVLVDDKVSVMIERRFTLSRYFYSVSKVALLTDPA